MMSSGCRPPKDASKEKPIRKARHTLMDLPLPRGGRYLQIWRKKFVPLLISWAGSQEDPFGTNGLIEGTVSSLWKRVYPDIDLEDTDTNIVVNVVWLLNSEFHTQFEVLIRQRTLSTTGAAILASKVTALSSTCGMQILLVSAQPRLGQSTSLTVSAIFDFCTSFQMPW